MQAGNVGAAVAAGMLGGLVGTKVMEPVSAKLYEWEPEADRRREDAVRPGSPYVLAARRTTLWLGLHLTDRQLQTVGTLVFHYGLGMSWGALYPVVRRVTTLDPLPAGLLIGAALSLLVDEGLTPALDLSDPNRAYPLTTHLRGVVAHLVYGLGVAATVEVLSRVGRSLAGWW